VETDNKMRKVVYTFATIWLIIYGIAECINTILFPPAIIFALIDFLLAVALLYYLSE